MLADFEFLFIFVIYSDESKAKSFGLSVFFAILGYIHIHSSLCKSNRKLFYSPALAFCKKQINFSHNQVVVHSHVWCPVFSLLSAGEGERDHTLSVWHGEWEVENAENKVMKSCKIVGSNSSDRSVQFMHGIDFGVLLKRNILPTPFSWWIRN